MDWIRENWFWIAVGVLFMWTHMKMHGGHGAQHHVDGHCGPGGVAPSEDRDEQGRKINAQR